MKRMKKGLFFGVSIALLIAVILIALSLWTSTVKTREAGEANKFELLSLKTIEASVSDEKLEELGKLEGKMALRELDLQVVNSGEYSKDIAGELGRLVSGGEFAKLNRTVAELAKERGFDFSITTKNFEVKQKDAWTVGLKFTADVMIRGKDGRIGISRSRLIEVDVPIEGLEDPLIGVESVRSGKGIKRTIFRDEHEYYVKNITDSGSFARGKGWAYGKVYGAEDSRGIGLLLAKENVDSVAGFANNYAGIISETAPRVTAVQKRLTSSGPECVSLCEYYVYEENSNCLDCMRWTDSKCASAQAIAGSCKEILPPNVLELTGRNEVDVPFVSGIRIGGAKAVLIDAHGNDSLSSFDRGRNSTLVSVWDIEKLREIASCGGYVGNPDAPDFLQRLMGEKNAKSENGIETLLLPGEVKGGAGQPLSMVDHVYYTGAGGSAIKGMPGCENAKECEGKWPSGVFALDEEHQKFYVADGLTCGNSSAPC